MKLTKEQQVTHLLNRFGLGATQPEVVTYADLGIEATKKRLIEYQSVPESFQFDRNRIYFDANKVASMDPGRAGLAWTLRMLTTDRPGESKLALFWHSHFAISGAKVEFGPAMMQYLDALTEHGNGKFETLLDRVSKTPAMIQWLDTNLSLKGRPNENFAREVMELFTLGIGNYTEKDVQESAKAFSGWNYRMAYYEIPAKDEYERACVFHRDGIPPVTFQDSPDMHDNGTKTFLGDTGPFTAEQILTKLAHHPKTAERLCRKLWEFYAYADPEPAIVSRLAKTYTSSGGDIKSVLYAIANSPEFWSEKAVGTMVRSPADFTIRIMRQMGVRDVLSAHFKPDQKFDEPVGQPVLDTLWITWQSMGNQGQLLMFPPDVSGWKWDTAWISPNVTVERGRLCDFIFAHWRKDDSPGKPFVDAITKSQIAWTPEKLIDHLLLKTQIELPPEKVKVLVDACNKAGGIGALAKPDSTSWMFHQVSRVLFSSPEAQFC